MPEPYGSFAWISCNILFRAGWDAGALTTLFPSSSEFFGPYNITEAMTIADPLARAARRAAGVGVASGCVIPHVGERESVGDIVLVVVSLFGIAVPLALAWRLFRNKLGVGTSELSLVLGTFALHSALQAVTQSSMLMQGSSHLLVLSAVHCAVGALLVWVLLCNTMVMWGSYETVYLVVLSLGASATFGATLYLALATGYRWTSLFNWDPQVRSIALFTLTLVWPAFALVAAFGAMFYIAEYRMHEREPALWLFGSATAIVVGQVVLFVGSQPLCTASGRIVNGAFLTALLNTLALVLFYRAWNLMGEASWSHTEHWMPRYSYHSSYGY